MRISDWSSDVCSSDLRIADVLAQTSWPRAAQPVCGIRLHPVAVLQVHRLAGDGLHLSGEARSVGGIARLSGHVCPRWHLLGESGGYTRIDCLDAAADRKSTRLNSSH